MKAAIINRYGPPEELEINELPAPEPGEEDVLIEVYASSVNPIDWKIRRGDLKLVYGNTFPKVLGGDVAGKIIRTGAKVGHLRPGDEVWAMLSQGGYAEYVCAKGSEVGIKPDDLSYKEAATIPLVGLTALQALKDKANIKKGQRVLVNGASGGVGSMAVQIAKAYGAEVTGVCSYRHLDMVKSLGADEVLDYTKEDFTQKGKRYDIIFDTNGNLKFRKCRKVLQPKGIFVTTVPKPGKFAGAFVSSLMPGKKLKVLIAKPDRKGLDELRILCEEGKLHPVIDSSFVLENIEKAHELSEAGHVGGKISLLIKKEAEMA